MKTEPILQKLTEIRASMPRKELTPPSRTTSRMRAQTLEEFEAEALAEALEGMADELHAAIEESHARLFEQALDTYYIAEDLARDPAHAHLIAHVENMRRAYEQSYGHPIPTREETEARRRGRST